MSSFRAETRALWIFGGLVSLRNILRWKGLYGAFTSLKRGRKRVGFQIRLFKTLLEVDNLFCAQKWGASVSFGIDSILNWLELD